MQAKTEFKQYKQVYKYVNGSQHWIQALRTSKQKCECKPTLNSSKQANIQIQVIEYIWMDYSPVNIVQRCNQRCKVTIDHQEYALHGEMLGYVMAVIFIDDG
jgi:hypothetical protein